MMSQPGWDNLTKKQMSEIMKEMSHQGPPQRKKPRLYGSQDRLNDAEEYDNYY